MILISRLNLISYLEEKEIFVVNNIENINYIEDKCEVFNQIENIIYFNKKIGECREVLIPRIRSNIFSDYESYKKQINILERYIKEIDKNNKDKIKEYIFIEGQELLYKCKEALKIIDECDFKKLILRSMKNYEICLNRVDEHNLFVDKDGKIFLGTIKYLSYNLKEHDIYSFIKRIKRKGINISIDEIISYYIEKENLNEESRGYLYGLSIYPNEEMKIIERFIRNKLSLNEEEALEALNLAKNIDNKLSYGGRVHE